MKVHWILAFVIGVILTLSFFSNAYSEITYSSLNNRVNSPPTYCYVEADDSEISDIQNREWANEVKRSVEEWNDKLQASEPTNKPLWVMKYLGEGEKPLPSCDYPIYFEPWAEEPEDWFRAAGHFLWSYINIYFLGIDFCEIDNETVQCFFWSMIKTGPEQGGTIKHEIGHSLGLDHYFSDNPEVTGSWYGLSILPSVMVSGIINHADVKQVTNVDVQKVRSIYGSDGFYAFSRQIAPPPPTPEPTPKFVAPKIPTNPFERIDITSSIIEVEPYSTEIVKIIGDISKEAFHQGQKVYITLEKPDGSTETLTITTTRKGHFETPILFDNNSMRGFYEVWGIYMEQRDRSMDIGFEVITKGEKSITSTILATPTTPTTPTQPTTPTTTESIVIPTKESEPTHPAQTTDDIVFDTFSNPDYGFSIKYPQNWIVNDEVEEYPAVAGYDDGSVSLVYFTDEPDPLSIWDHYIAISFSKNNYNARNYEGQDYLNAIEMSEEEFCKWDIDQGYGCSYSKIDSKIFEINGRKAYQITTKISFTYPDTPFLDEQTIGIFTEIIDGNNVWSVYSSSNEIEYPKVATIIEEIINSFSIEGDDTQQLSVASTKLPDWIKNNAKWWSEGSIGDDDFTSGIQFMIKENIMVIPDLPEVTQMELKDEKRAMGLERDKNVPDWVRNNAGWWANGLISEDDFVGGIKYLVEQGIIIISKN